MKWAGGEMLDSAKSYRKENMIQKINLNMIQKLNQNMIQKLNHNMILKNIK